MFLCIFVLFFSFVWGIAGSSNLRDVLIRPAYSNDVEMGKAISAVFVELISQFPRISVWSFSSFSYQYNPNAPKDINFESINWEGIMEFVTQERYAELGYSDFDAIVASIQEISRVAFMDDDIPNYFQGLLLTCVLGMIPLLVAILLWPVGRVLSWYQICRTFCCPAKMKAKTFEKWQKKRKRRRCVVSSCRWWIVAVGLVSIPVMLAWGFFSYQSQIGISTSFTDLEEKYTTVTNFVDNVFELPNSAREIVTTLGELYNETVDEVMKILPIGDALIPHIECVENIIASLPDLGKIQDFLVDVEASFATLPSFAPVENLGGNVTMWLDKMKYEDLVNLENQLTAVTDSLDAVGDYLDVLTPQIASIDIMKDAFPSNEEMTAMKRDVESIEVVKTEILTDEFEESFVLHLNNLDLYPGKTVAAEIRQFQRAINIFDAIDFDGMNTTLVRLGQGVALAPDVEAISETIGALGGEIDSIDLSGIQPSLVALNDSIYGLIGVMERLPEVLDYLESTILGLIPDFSPLVTELDKIEDTIIIAACISNITQMVVDFNSTVIILPSEISAMISQIGDMQGFLRSEINFDEVLGTIDDMISVVEGQIQTAIADVGNMTVDSVLSDMPDIGEMSSDIDTAVVDFDSGKGDFDVSELGETMKDMNSSISDTPAVDGYFNTISEVVNATEPAIAQNSTIGTTAEFLESLGDDPCFPCPGGVVAGAAVIASLVGSVKESSDAVPTEDLFDVISSFNDTMSDLPDSAEYLGKISDLEATLEGMPDIAGICTQIQQANDTIAGMAFGDFGALIDQFSTSLDGFDMSTITTSLDSVAPMYDQINDTSIFSNFDMLNEQLDPMLNQVPQMLTVVLSQIDDFNSTILSQLAFYVDMGKYYKEIAMGYVDEYDGWRLLIMLFLIILVVPLPSLLVLYACCFRSPECLCYRKTACGWLIGFGVDLLSFAVICFIFPAVGVPIGIAMNEGCSRVDYYVNSAYSTLTDAVGSFNMSTISPEGAQQLEMLGINITNLLREGLTPEFASSVVSTQMEQLNELSPNQTFPPLEINFDFEPILIDEILLNYLSTTSPCEGDDILGVIDNVFNSSVFAVFDGIETMLGGFEIMEGFTIHPKFPRILRNIFVPMIANVSQFFQYAEPIVGCENLNGVLEVAYDLVCEKFRYSFMFFWGMMLILGIIFTITSLVAWIAFCHYDCCYYPKKNDPSSNPTPGGPGVGGVKGGGKGVVPVQQLRPPMRMPMPMMQMRQPYAPQKGGVMVMMPQTMPRVGGGVQVLPMTAGQNFVVRTNLQ